MAAPLSPPVMAASVMAAPVTAPLLRVVRRDRRGRAPGARRQRVGVGLRGQLVEHRDLRPGDPDARDAGLLPAVGREDRAVGVGARDDLVDAVGDALGDVDVLLGQVPGVDVAPPR